MDIFISITVTFTVIEMVTFTVTVTIWHGQAKEKLQTQNNLCIITGNYRFKISVWRLILIKYLNFKINHRGPNDLLPIGWRGTFRSSSAHNEAEEETYSYSMAWNNHRLVRSPLYLNFWFGRNLALHHTNALSLSCCLVSSFRVYCILSTMNLH